jgi:hypothetical protein
MTREYQGPSAGEIADMLRDHVESLVSMVFPAARRAGGYMAVGSLEGEPGDSLMIQLRGPKRGTWADYAMSKGDPRGTGDMLKLLQLTVGGGDLRKGIDEAKRFLNLDTMDPRALERMQDRAKKARARAETQAADDGERRRRNAEGLWQAGVPLTPSSPAVKYLEGRGIDFARLGKLPGALRYHPKVHHAETGRKLPAIVTKATALDGRHAATHLTYLALGASGWVKLPPVAVERADETTGEVTVEHVGCAKKIFGPWWPLGAHAALWKGEQRGPLKDVRPGTPVHVSEGIEDGLSYAMADPGARVVMAGTLGNIAVMRLPEQAGDLVLLAQNDTKAAPLAAREDAIKAQQAQARAQGSSRSVRLKLPPQGIKDWNDWLREVEA